MYISNLHHLLAKAAFAVYLRVALVSVALVVAIYRDRPRVKRATPGHADRSVVQEGVGKFPPAVRVPDLHVDQVARVV